MKLYLWAALVTIVTTVGCERRVAVEAPPVVTPSVPAPTPAQISTERLYVGSGLAGLDQLDPAAVLSPAEMRMLFERAYADSDGASSLLFHEGSTWSAEPVIAFTVSDRTYLVVVHGMDNAPHAAGGFASYFVFADLESAPVESYPFSTISGSWGAQPDVKIALLPGSVPAVLVSGGGTWQGCTIGTLNVVRMTHSGPIASDRFIPVYYDDEPAGWDVSSQVNLVGVELSADGGSLTLQYAGSTSQSGVAQPVSDRRNYLLDGPNTWLDEFPYSC